MRRLVLSLSLVVFGLTGTARPAAAVSPTCEAYCVVVASSCYLTLGWFIGRDKCDAMYEGCVAGCQAAAAEAEEGLQEQ